MNLILQYGSDCHANCESFYTNTWEALKDIKKLQEDIQEYIFCIF